MAVFGVSLISGIGAGFGGILILSTEPQRHFMMLWAWAETHLRGRPDPMEKEVLFCISFGGITAVLWSSHTSQCKPAQQHLQVFLPPGAPVELLQMA